MHTIYIMDFLSKILPVVFWPLSVLIIFFKLKDPIKNLIDRVVKIRFPGGRSIDAALDTTRLKITEKGEIVLTKEQAKEIKELFDDNENQLNGVLEQAFAWKFEYLNLLYTSNMKKALLFFVRDAGKVTDTDLFYYHHCDLKLHFERQKTEQILGSFIFYGMVEKCSDNYNHKITKVGIIFLQYVGLLSDHSD